MSNRAIILFCGIAFALSWSIQLAVLAVFGSPENPAGRGWLVTTMFTPALVTLGFALFSRDARACIAWKPRWRMIPLSVVAFIVPTVVAFATVAIVTATGMGKSGWFVFSQTNVAIS